MEIVIAVVGGLSLLIGGCMGYALRATRAVPGEALYEAWLADFADKGPIQPPEPWEWQYPVASPADDVTERRAVFVWDDELAVWDMERWLPDDDWPLMALAARLVETNRTNGWDRYNNPRAWEEDPDAIPIAISLIHSEASEALEDYREGDREHFGEELADVIIRVLDLAHGVGVDLDAEVERKNEINKGRGYRHGGKRA